MTTFDILTKWINIARIRGNKALVLALWHARDIADGTASFYDPDDLAALKADITRAFDVMDQTSDELIQVRKELGL